MGLSRKDFLFSTAGLFAMAGGLTRNDFAKAAFKEPLSGTRMATLYDSSKCIGCRMCEEGCIKENNLPRARELGKLSKTSWTAIKATPNSNRKNLFLKLQCMHCTDASCVAVCPTGAAAHHGESVVISQDWCIGCGYCEEACPFGVPHRGHPPGTAQKCTFCLDRVRSGSIPACAEACPTGATTYGVREDLLTTAKTRVQNLVKVGWPDAQLYGENELGGLGVMYILLKPPAFYGLPEQPRQATENVLAQWTSGGLTAAVLIAPFWFLYNRVSVKDKQLLKQKEGKE
jgi:formate dehydrogenase iron-sulfur subunit